MMSHREIAKVLGISKSLVQKTYRSLESLLPKDIPEKPEGWVEPSPFWRMMLATLRKRPK